MRVEISNYIIETDSLQFILKEKGIVQESRLTKAENVGKEKETTLGYYTKFEQALSAIPQEVLKGNDDTVIIKDKLNQIKADIKQIKEYPVIVVKEEKETKEDEISINKKYYEQLLEYEKKLDALECAGVDNWGGYDDAMEILINESEEE